MTKLRCCFCQQELHKDSDGYYTCYTDNCGCWANGGNGASGSESLWLTLIRARKALDVAVDALKSAHEYYEYCIQRDYVGDDINWDCTAMNMDNDISEALEQITALEQKEQ